MWIKIIGAVIALIGVILIYDSRRLVRKYFADAEENMTAFGMKIFGVLLVIIGGIMNVI